MIYILFLSILILLTCFRIVMGKSIGDMVVALDTANTLTISLMVLYAVYIRESFYIDVAITYALLSFIGVVYIARYIEGKL